MKYKGAFMVGAAIGLVLIGSIAFSTSPKNVTSDTSFDDMPQLEKNATIEEQLEWKNQFTEWAESKGSISHFSGEKTRGTTIEISGELVKLPEDVELGGLVVEDQGLGQNSEYRKSLPFYVIIRDQSRIMIGQNTGIVVNLILDPAKKNRSAEVEFDFLKEHIKGYLPEVK